MIALISPWPARYLCALLNREACIGSDSAKGWQMSAEGPLFTLSLVKNGASMIRSATRISNRGTRGDKLVRPGNGLLETGFASAVPG